MNSEQLFKSADKSFESTAEAANEKKQISKQTLWIVTELYYPEETSTGYYLTRAAEGLAGDFNVKVLCGQPNYSGRGIRAPKREVHERVEIFRAFGTTLDKNVILFRLINMLSLSFSVFWKSLFNFRKGDKIMVVTTPPSLPFITALASLLRGGSYVLLIHDNYPEILVAVGKTQENSFLVKTIDFFNRWLYKYASKIIVVGRDMRKLVEKKTYGLDIPIEYIPNWAELEQVGPAPRSENELLHALGLEEKFVFLYAGNLGHPNDLESIAWCAEKLKSDERFHFIFLGAGVKRKWLENEVEEKNLTNVTMLAPRPRSEQNIFLNACDVAIVSLVKKMWGVSMPSRTYNILAVGKPILALAEEGSEAAIVVTEDCAGWIVPPNEPEKLLQTFYKIYQEREKIPEMQKSARAAALAKYSSETAVSLYKKALK
ncbi:MAG TPA: glycosyltransferase family 4 protein [Pyrinomonadaceae bacterium]